MVKTPSKEKEQSEKEGVKVVEESKHPQKQRQESKLKKYLIWGFILLMLLFIVAYFFVYISA